MLGSLQCSFLELFHFLCLGSYFAFGRELVVDKQHLQKEGQLLLFFSEDKLGSGVYSILTTDRAAKTSNLFLTFLEAGKRRWQVQ